MSTTDPLLDYGRRVPAFQTAQVLPTQVRNSAGGYVFRVDNWHRLRRFLILGTASGTFYASARALTADNVPAIDACIAEDPERVLTMVREVSLGGQAAKQQPTLFVYAKLCAEPTPLEIRQRALAILPQICRIPTHLFMWLNYVQNHRGWGRSLRRAVADWYLDRDAGDLARLMTKYQRREGWTHRDVLRKAKPVPGAWSDHDKLFAWATGKGPAHDPYVSAHEHAMAATNVPGVVGLIHEFNLPWESVNPALLREPEVWKALAPHMGITALIRNLGRMTSVGAIKPMGDPLAVAVRNRLSDAETISRSRIHPLAVLTALATYQKGRGDLGSLTWSPVREVVEGLDAAWRLSFDNIEPAGKRTMIGLDVSGSMSQAVMGGPLSAYEASAAIAQMIVATEPATHTMAFSHVPTPFPISSTEPVGSVVARAQEMRFGGTDCSLPMAVALHEEFEVDTFVVITDSETWSGRIHPFQALEVYRESMNRPWAKLIVVGMTSTGFSIANPDDGGMLDVVGLSTDTPKIIADFSAGRI